MPKNSRTCPAKDLAISTGITLIKEIQILFLHKELTTTEFSGPYFATFGLNMKRYGVSLHIQSECWKTWTRKTPNTEIFHVALRFKIDFNYTTVSQNRRIYKKFNTISLQGSVLLFKKIVYIVSLTNIKDSWILQCSCWVWSSFCKELLINGKW